MATILHIENTVHDYDQWKAAFDKYERMRSEKGVRSYRIARHADDAAKVVVDLEFDNAVEARAFREVLHKIWQTPQSRAELMDHNDPVILELVENRVLAPSAVTTS